MNIRKMLLPVRTMRQLSLALAALLFFFSVTGYATQEQSDQNDQIEQKRLLDYDTLDHTQTLLRLRAGNHGKSPDGVNQYYFKVILTGLIDEESQHILEFDKKKKVVQEYQNFGDLELKAFRSYLPDEKGKNTISLTVKGDAVREVVRRAMNELTSDKGSPLLESEIGVKIDVSLYIRQKKYFILEDDQLIQKTSYFVLPFRSSDKKLQEEQSLILEDEKGLHGEVAVSFNKEKK